MSFVCSFSRPFAVSKSTIMLRRLLKHNSTASTNIYQTFLPFYMVLKAFGFIPFSIRHGKGTAAVTLTLSDRIALGCWTTFYALLLCLNIVWGQQEPDAEKSMLIKHGWHKLYLLEMATLAYVVLSNFIKRSSIVECLRLMDQFDLCKVRKGLLIDRSLYLFAFRTLCLHDDFNKHSVYQQQQQQHNATHEINHTVQRSMAIRFISFGFFWLAAKSLISFALLDSTQRDAIHLLSLASYVLSSGLIAVVTFQFNFFSFCLEQRYRVFVENFVDAAAESRFEEDNLIKIYSIQFTILTKIVERLNGTFSIQVNAYHSRQLFLQIDISLSSFISRSFFSR